MAYETSAFGSADGSNVTTDVSNHYGARDIGDVAGVYNTSGSDNELTVIATSDAINDGFLPNVYIPAGAAITKAVAHVTEAFVVTGTDPTILIGTDGSEATNGAVLDEASAEAVGYYDITSTLTGTWSADTRLAADTLVGLALGGTTPAITDVGRVVFIITYTDVAQ